ncbi:hypothetical protein J6590_071970 [Homalodisca vitripennis]|nr:hypothetical protein J6590_091390 [Homalodisca vitripennis]KAG8309998.1 hypothetical protein J6590_071970 [Homalodisca vitripennis]
MGLHSSTNHLRLAVQKHCYRVAGLVGLAGVVSGAAAPLPHASHAGLSRYLAKQYNRTPSANKAMTAQPTAGNRIFIISHFRGVTAVLS